MSRNGNSARALARTLSPQMTLFTISDGLEIWLGKFSIDVRPFAAPADRVPWLCELPSPHYPPCRSSLLCVVLCVLPVLPVCFKPIFVRPVLAFANHATILCISGYQNFVTRITRTVFSIALDVQEINPATTECGEHCRLRACCSKLTPLYRPVTARLICWPLSTCPHNVRLINMPRFQYIAQRIGTAACL